MNRKLRFALAGAAATLCLGAAVAQGLSPITGLESSYRNSIFQVGILRVSRDEAITATPSGTVTTSYQLVYGANRITTVASSGDGVKLPQCQGGKMVWIVNAAASNPANVFPFSSTETINALSAGTAFSLAANKAVIAFCGFDGAWYTNLTASLESLKLASNKAPRLAA